MLNHQNIWRGIDKLAQEHGYSASGLAKKAGLDPTSFNKSKRMSSNGKPRWPSTESLSKILAVTNTAMSEFLTYIGDEAADYMPVNQNVIPLIGLAQAGRNGFFDSDGYPTGDNWDSIALPMTHENSNLFALEINGDSMEPLYRKGDILVVSSNANIHKNDRLIVKTISGEVMAKELEQNTQKALQLKSLNAEYESYNVPIENIEWTARILWVSQ